MTIQPGDIVIHKNGTVARVVIPPTEDDVRIGVAFLLGRKSVMEMAWEPYYIAQIEKPEPAPGHEHLPQQMKLWQ